MYTCPLLRFATKSERRFPEADQCVGTASLRQLLMPCCTHTGAPGGVNRVLTFQEHASKSQ